VEIYDKFPESCHYLLKAIEQIYSVEHEALKQNLSKKERLALHQRESGPVMEELKKWLDEQIEQKLVEPSSDLGKAIAYMRNHFCELTRFLWVEGAPLDNNVVERALKIAQRHRKNSMFYRSEHGALAGDIQMSLIHTCVQAQENPLEYLIALQENKSHVHQNPSQWLPWNYRHSMKSSQELRDLSPPFK